MISCIEEVLLKRFSNIFFRVFEVKSSFRGFECGDGWYGIIGGTLLFIEQHTQNHNVQIQQVKEKFGRLRIYYRGTDECIDTVIDIAEIVSGEICEACGCRGSLKETEGWLRVRCDNVCRSATIDMVEAENYQQNFAVAMIAVISFFGVHAVEWVKTSQLAFGNRCPSELLTSADGCREVVLHVGRLVYGVGV
jgi:hypothetical protein